MTIKVDRASPRKAFVTGGSGSIGSAIVRSLAGEGYDVAFQYWSDARSAAGLQEETGVVGVQVDLSDTSSVATLGLADVDVLVNCAAVNISSDFVSDVSLTTWNRTLAVNLTAPFLLCQMVLPHMKERNWGRIVNVGSIYSYRGSTNNSPYNSSKHGLRGLTKSVAKEFARWGITANDVLPGAVESRLMERIAIQNADGRSSLATEYLDNVRRASPNRRMAYPSDVAAAVVFLASDQASHANGIELVLDGGLTA